MKYISSSDYTVAEKHYRASWLFRNMYVAAKQYKSLLGKDFWDESYPLVKLVYPSTECSPVSCASGGKIYINRESSSDDDYDDYTTLLHEWAHWIAGRDAAISTKSVGDYCQNHQSSTWPGSERPYLYEDPDYSSGDCGHGMDTWEDDGRVSAEGFAEAFADFMEDGECGDAYRWGEQLSGFDGLFAHPDGVNFDKTNRDRNGYRFYCGLFNTASGGKTWMHAYASDGYMESFIPRQYTTDASANSRYAYAAKDMKVYRVRLATGDESEFEDATALFTASGKVDDVTASDDVVCISFQSKKIACRSLAVADKGSLLSGSGSGLPSKGGISSTDFTEIALSSSISSVIDIALSGEKLYVLTWEWSSSGWHFVVYRNSATSGTWSPTTIFSQDPAGASSGDYKSIAVAESQDLLFLSRTNSIDSCALSSCSSVSNWAGKADYTGYYRKSRLKSFFYAIGEIFVTGDYLYIRDEYGIARIHTTDKAIEQHVGIGADRVFVNNLSLRSMGYAGDHLVYATNGADSMLEIGHVLYDEQRNETDPTSVMIRYHVNEDMEVTKKYYCGSESVQASAYDVAHGFKGIWFYSSLSDVAANISGISSSETDDLKDAAWATLDDDGCTWSGAGEYRGDDGYISFEEGEEPSSWKLSERLVTPTKIEADLLRKSTFEKWQRRHRLDPKGLNPDELKQDEKRGTASVRKASVVKNGGLKAKKRTFKKTGSLLTK